MTNMVNQSLKARGQSPMAPSRGWKQIPLDRHLKNLVDENCSHVPYWAALLSQAPHINCPADQIEYIEQQLADVVARRME